MKAYEIVDNGWCQQVNALNRDGEATYALDSEAVAFCATGAIRRAYHVRSGQTMDDVWRAYRRYEGVKECLADEVGVPVLDINAWNDEPDRTKEEVVGALKRAEDRYYNLIDR